MGHNKAAALRGDIAREIASLERLVSEAEQLLQDLPEPPSFRETRAAGSILHDFYTAVERIFRQIALHVDGDLPKGDDWHIQLLRRMATDIQSVRPPVIDQGLERDLSEYLRFRHLFRNIYGFDLRWDLLDRLFRRLPSVESNVAAQLSHFSAFLSSLPDN
jgi:hypothetical protein